MPLKEWNGSSWQVVAQLKVWNGTSWVALNAVDNAKTARVWNGSSWVQFHPGVQLQSKTGYSGSVTLHSDALAFSPDTAMATVGINLYSSGLAEYVDASGIQSFNWLLTGSNSDYYAYMDTPSGDPFSTGTTATSLQLNTNRAWSLFAYQAFVGSTSKSLTSTLRIKNSSGTDILSISVDLSVYAEVF